MDVVMGKRIRGKRDDAVRVFLLRQGIPLSTVNTAIADANRTGTGTIDVLNRTGDKRTSVLLEVF